MTAFAVLVTIFAFAVFVTIVSAGVLLLFGEFYFVRLMWAFLSAVVLGFACWGLVAVVLWVWGAA